MSKLKDFWDGLFHTTAPTPKYYYSDSSYNDYHGGSYSYNLMILAIAGVCVGGILVLVCLCCMIRGCCNIARKQNCSLLCRTCGRSCRSQCGTADVSQEEAILRPYEGIMENDKLLTKSVVENRILKAIVCDINRARSWLQLETKLVGSLKERLGKPTRVITNDYPSGLPSRSPLCTDIDVMMISKAPHMIATHYNNAIDRLIIIPSPSTKGFVKVMIPSSLYNNRSMSFLQSMSAREDSYNPPQSLIFLSADLVKETFMTSLRKLNVKKLVKQTKAKLKNHKRALRVEPAGPAVKVVIRQQMSSCTRCCMLGQCSLRLCCCMANCLMEEELDVLFEGDFTFALRVSEWPVIANEWVTRTRVWPYPNVVQMILAEGCALVPKSEWGEELLWRYSFSEAETNLMNCVPPATHKAMLAIKGLLKRVGCPLKSYCLKSMLFWCLETPRDSSEFWSDLKNLPGIFNHLLNEFLAMIKEGRCRNYFIRDINLMEQANNVSSIIESLEQLVVDPYCHLTTRALEKSRCCAMSSLICRLLCGCHDTELTLDVY